jgi:hypothetical protein
MNTEPLADQVRQAVYAVRSMIKVRLASGGTRWRALGGILSTCSAEGVTTPSGKKVSGPMLRRMKWGGGRVAGPFEYSTGPSRSEPDAHADAVGVVAFAEVAEIAVAAAAVVQPVENLEIGTSDMGDRDFRPEVE